MGVSTQVEVYLKRLKWYFNALFRVIFESIFS